MKIKKFSAENFRNIKKCEIQFTDGVNLIYGGNALGKTNVIEGIYLFSRGKSFRTSQEKDTKVLTVAVLLNMRASAEKKDEEKTDIT